MPNDPQYNFYDSLPLRAAQLAGPQRITVHPYPLSDSDSDEAGGSGNKAGVAASVDELYPDDWAPAWTPERDALYPQDWREPWSPAREASYPDDWSFIASSNVQPEPQVRAASPLAESAGPRVSSFAVVSGGQRPPEASVVAGVQSAQDALPDHVSTSPSSGLFPYIPPQPNPALSPRAGEDAASVGSGVLADVGKSAGIGTAEGAIGLVGLPGDLRELLASGVQRAADSIVPGSAPHAGQMASELLTTLNPLFAGPSSSLIQQAIEAYTGPFYQPKTIAGEYARTFGEFAPFAFVPEGGLARGVLRNVAIPALASETAGQLTKGTAAEPWARAIAGLAAHAPGAWRLFQRSPFTWSPGPQFVARPYGELKGTLAKGWQAHHLNQHAVYREYIAHDEGLSVPMRGDVFSEPKSQHRIYHESMERKFWDHYRLGGRLQGRKPTNADYDNASRRAFVDADVPAPQAEQWIAQAAAERSRAGLAATDPVPRVPRRINWKKKRIFHWKRN